MQINEVQERLEKNAHLLMIPLVLYVFVRGLVGAATRPLAFDEILTKIVASQPSLKDIWVALSKAVDGQAPAHYVVERVVLHLVSNENIALRIPSVLAMGCIFVFLFIYLRKRSGAWIAFLCTFFVLSTGVFRYFADVARPYTMLLACFAFALVCYQRLPSLRWATLLALSLGLAQCFHYYAIFVLAPFGISESVFLLKERQLRWQAWAALSFGALPLLFEWPLLSATRSFFGAHYWAYFGVTDIVKGYGSILWTTTAYGAGITAICVAVVIGPRLWPKFINSPGSKPNEDDLAEDLLVLGFLALLPIVFVVTKLMHGGMVDRYALATLFGIPLALARIFSRADAKVVGLFGLFLFCAVGTNEVGFWRSVHPLPSGPLSAPIEQFVTAAGHPELPVVVSNGLTVLPLAYYASPSWKRRFVFVDDPEKALRYRGTDNVDKVVRNLRGYFPLEIQDYSEFIKAHPSFLLYREDPSPGFEWLPLHLAHEGATMQVVRLSENGVVYLVTMKDAIESETPH